MKAFFKKKVVPILIDVLKEALSQTILWAAKNLASMLSKKFDGAKAGFAA